MSVLALCLWCFALRLVVTSILRSSFLPSRDFLIYMGICASRPPVLLRDFGPSSVSPRSVTRSPSSVDLHTNPASFPPSLPFRSLLTSCLAEPSLLLTLFNFVALPSLFVVVSVAVSQCETLLCCLPLVLTSFFPGTTKGSLMGFTSIPLPRLVCFSVRSYLFGF